MTTPDATAGAEEDRAVREERAVREALALVAQAPVDEPGDAPRTAPAHRGQQTRREPEGAGGAGPEPAVRARPGGTAASAAPQHGATDWDQARQCAARAGSAVRGDVHRVRLGQALGEVLAAPLEALTDLPSFDTSAMDGWAVAGPGPWNVRAGDILAGDAHPEPLADGAAVRIATGARVPADTTAVIRSEHSRVEAGRRLFAQADVVPGQDIRPRGQECRAGDLLLPAGSRVTPAVLGLAAAAGYDDLQTVARPCAEVLVLGDELLTEGRPREGLIRDALGPMLGPWLTALGADVVGTRRIGDTEDALHAAISGSDADLVLTTGGTAAGPVDHVHPALHRAGAELLVDGVRVRPGHPMLLARLDARRHLVGLPGNPLAAVSGLLTLAEPLLRMLSGQALRPRSCAPVGEDVPGHPHDTRLIPVTLRAELAVPLRYNGPAMLRGIATADALAVVPPHGAKAGQELELLDLPWVAGGFT
ncbi:molybdopterin molybdotransferase MoeA [Streptomyces sp. NPDC006879]|uniref:molybdopterin molybdotransferase MoeA n=1 Tax=Streptomyces sp. NPDC006879 TaxID=3364767 RepID=UPI0036C61388